MLLQLIEHGAIGVVLPRDPSTDLFQLRVERFRVQLSGLQVLARSRAKKVARRPIPALVELLPCQIQRNIAR